MAYLLCLFCFYFHVIASPSLSQSPTEVSWGPGPAGRSCPAGQSCPAADTHLGQPPRHSRCVTLPSCLCQFCSLLIPPPQALLWCLLLPPHFLRHPCWLPVLAALGLAAGTCCAHILIEPNARECGPTLLTLVLPLTLWKWHWHLTLGFQSWLSPRSWQVPFPLLLQGGTPSTFLLWDLTVMGTPPAPQCLLVPLGVGLAQQAWPRVTWTLLSPPAYLPSTVAELFGQVDSGVFVHWSEGLRQSTPTGRGRCNSM